jgi:hypothetical protein
MFAFIIGQMSGLCPGSVLEIISKESFNLFVMIEKKADAKLGS